MPDTPKRIIKHRQERSSTFEQRNDEKSREFYQTYTWRKFRAKDKLMKRRSDEKRVHQLYNQMPNTTFESLVSWMTDKKQSPLCVDCIDEGYIRAAQVADHQKRIRDGGAKLSHSNINWRCSHHHNIKSGKEAHE